MTEKGAALIGKHLTSLTGLDISQNRIGAGGALSIIQRLELRYLQIQYCGIGSSGFACIIRNMGPLLQLRVEGNEITHEEVCAQVKVLDQLEYLSADSFLGQDYRDSENAMKKLMPNT